MLGVSDGQELSGEPTPWSARPAQRRRLTGFGEQSRMVKAEMGRLEERWRAVAEEAPGW